MTGVACPTCGKDARNGTSFDVGNMRRHHAQAHGESLTKVKRACPTCGETHYNKRFCSHECRDTSDWSDKVGDSIKELHRTGEGSYDKEWREKVGNEGEANGMFGRSPSGNARYVDELGHVVRSNWEERVAKAFVENGISYEYEPERFDLDNVTYVPDFKVGETVIEVKGYASPDCVRKAELFMEMEDRRYVVIQKVGGSRLSCDVWIEWPEIDQLIQATGV